MSDIIGRINEFFISVMLTAVYLVVIGISSAIMKALKTSVPKKEYSSYWQEGKKQPLNRKYFQSDY